MTTPDVIVIGAGFSGLCAALFAAQAGARVAVVAAGFGTTHWIAGTIDVFGFRGNGDATVIDDPRAAVSAIAAAARHDGAPAAGLDACRHPYAAAGVDALDRGARALQEVLAAAGLPYEGALSRNQIVPSVAGAPRPTCLVPPSAARDAALSGRVLVAGVRGIRDFFPEWIAANLRARALDARPVDVDVSALSARRPQLQTIAAATLEQGGAAGDLARALLPHVADRDVVVLPAILGVGAHARVHEELCETLGRPVYELPTLPPSVPGLRIHTALSRALARLGVTIEVGQAIIGGRITGGRLQEVRATTSARPRVWAAGAFIVATGGLLGGGLIGTPEGTILDVALDLPVAQPPDRSAWLRPADDRRGQPVFRSGYRVDAAMRVLDAGGGAVADNVTAAGSAIAGADVWRELSHEGVAIATAWRAAQTAVSRS